MSSLKFHDGNKIIRAIRDDVEETWRRNRPNEQQIAKAQEKRW